MNRILNFFMRPERKEPTMSMNQIEELAIGEITHEAKAILGGLEHLKSQLADALAHNKILIASEAAAKAELAKFKAEAAESLRALKASLGFVDDQAETNAGNDTIAGPSGQDHVLEGLADHPDDVAPIRTQVIDLGATGAAGNDTISAVSQSTLVLPEGAVGAEVVAGTAPTVGNAYLDTVNTTGVAAAAAAG